MLSLSSSLSLSLSLLLLSLQLFLLLLLLLSLLSLSLLASLLLSLLSFIIVITIIIFIFVLCYWLYPQYVSARCSLLILPKEYLMFFISVKQEHTKSYIVTILDNTKGIIRPYSTVTRNLYWKAKLFWILLWYHAILYVFFLHIRQKRREQYSGMLKWFHEVKLFSQRLNRHHFR